MLQITLTMEHTEDNGDQVGYRLVSRINVANLHHQEPALMAMFGPDEVIKAVKSAVSVVRGGDLDGYEKVLVNDEELSLGLQALWSDIVQRETKETR